MLMITYRALPTGSSRWRAVACLAMVLAAAPAVAQYSSGSSGIHGPFPPIPEGQTDIPAATDFIVWNITTGLVRYCSAYSPTNFPETCTTELATAQIPNIPQPDGLTTGVYEFTDVSIRPGASVGGVDVYIVGNVRNVPLTILAQDDIVIGQTGKTITLRLAGQTGKAPSPVWASAAGGKAGPGGYQGGAGGNGGEAPENGSAGFGPAGGTGGTTSTTDGQAFRGGNPGTSPATVSLTPLVGGSGGGGGAGAQSGNPLGCGSSTFGLGGAGGGGGGGAVLLAAEDRIEFLGTSRIYVQGGLGSYNSSAQAACVRLEGAGGAGGSIRLVARTVTSGSSTHLALDGGHTGWFNIAAPGGRVRIEAFTNTFTGGISGLTSGSFVAYPLDPIPPTLPTLSITMVGGQGVGDDPKNDLQNPDVTFATPPADPAPVELVLTAPEPIPAGTTAYVRATPLAGAFTEATSSEFSGTGPYTATALVAIPPGYGSVHASTSYSVSQGQLAAMGLRNIPMIDGDVPDRVEVVAQGGGASEVYLLTPGGRRYLVRPSGEIVLK